MSMFGRLRKAKKAGHERKSESSTATDSQTKPTPYRHVPTHAACDSLACAPPGWKEVEDRKSIQAQHERRSEMSRSTSGLSVVTTMHRGDSYNYNDWTLTTIDQRKGSFHTPVMPESRTTRRLSPLHASGTEDLVLMTVSTDDSSRIVQCPQL